MKRVVVKGGNRVSGKIEIAGAKNAVLPIIAASILSDQDLIISNIPHVADVSTMLSLVSSLGVNVDFDGSDLNSGPQGKVVALNGKNITNLTGHYDLVRKMRASVLILGPLLARFGEAKVSLPGGCAIGVRPIDLHISALKKMGAEITIENGYVHGVAKNGLKGELIDFEMVSVGATESILMAACLAKGETIITNAAMEPEVQDLAHCLNSMGAKITGIGESTMHIQGVTGFKKANHAIIGDRIEAGTYAIAALMTGGELELHGTNADIWGFKDKLIEAGAKIVQTSPNIVTVTANSSIIHPIDLSTHPYPGFPTDMQAQFMALASVADGKSVIIENLFENRFMHVLELARMGADISLNKNVAIVKGVKKLAGAEVTATDLRASVSLVLAGLVAEGETTISRIYHLERGYERLAEKLSHCGADVSVVA